MFRLRERLAVRRLGGLPSGALSFGHLETDPTLPPLMCDVLTQLLVLADMDGKMELKTTLLHQWNDPCKVVRSVGELLTEAGRPCRILTRHVNDEAIEMRVIPVTA